MKLTGWGRYPTTTADMLEPANRQAVAVQLDELRAQARQLIVRGAGRSYGDAALAATVLGSRHLDNLIALEADNGGGAYLRCAAGVSLGAILHAVLPKGYFLPVLPGTRFVTVGGAIAADIHGKNHHRDGCFSAYVDSFTLLLANGELRQCSRSENRELFAATCGGMGLTGMILDARLRLNKVPGHFINNRTLVAKSLRQCLELFEEHNSAHYSVAWIDCLSRGSQLGRSSLFLGEHSDRPASTSSKPLHSGTLASIPFATPAWLLNRYSMRAFNALYYWRQQSRSKQQELHYQHYFFPLDRIANWNRLYGRQGFIQYQLVLPTESAAEGLEKILQRVSGAGKGSFLAVLKQLGPANDNLLSFPLAGYTLTLDFKMEERVLPLLDELDAIVLGHGGRLYLAKDARMNEAVFKASYPRWEDFMSLRATVDPEGLFTSLLAQRLGLDRYASGHHGLAK